MMTRKGCSPGITRTAVLRLESLESRLSVDMVNKEGTLDLGRLALV